MAGDCHGSWSVLRDRRSGSHEGMNVTWVRGIRVTSRRVGREGWGWRDKGKTKERGNIKRTHLLGKEIAN